MANLYYYDSNGQKRGPVSFEQLKQLALQGVVSPETKLETEEGKTGQAKNVKDLTFPETAIQEPIQPESATTDQATPEAAPQELTRVKPEPSVTEGIEHGDNLSEPGASALPIQDSVEPSATPDSPADSESLMPEPTPDVAERVLSELKPLIAALSKKVESLTSELDFYKQLVERRQEQIDTLYEENRGYRDDIIGQFKKKLVQGVIEQIDAAYKQISTFKKREESAKDYKNLLEAFEEIADDFRDMLRNRLGIMSFDSNPGEKFVPARHNAMKRESTGDQSKDTTISQSVRYGYANSDGSIMRPEFVDVFYYDASLPPPVADKMESTVRPVEEQNEDPHIAPTDSIETETATQNTANV